METFTKLFGSLLACNTALHTHIWGRCNYAPIPNHVGIRVAPRLDRAQHEPTHLQARYQLHIVGDLRKSRNIG
ncbi:MAG: hypothetical protein HYZ57_01165 [Acidobacteria bacterium]|nr:hypothetical protein [Acidobacteriota bacterium]